MAWVAAKAYVWSLARELPYGVGATKKNLEIHHFPLSVARAGEFKHASNAIGELVF